MLRLDQALGKPTRRMPKIANKCLIFQVKPFAGSAVFRHYCQTVKVLLFEKSHRETHSS